MRSIAERLAYNRRNPNKLNPVLFDEDGKLFPEIRDKLVAIVDEFLDYIQVSIKILDIRMVGSNASYNYNEYSDLDVHIITDLSKISDPETIARLYFDSAKKNFKDSFDITVKGIEVEIYVEDVNTGAVSNGVYSIQSDKWIKEPVPVDPPSDEEIEKAEEIEEDILKQIKSADSTEELEDIIDKLYIMRKDALADAGETGAGNLVFKSLRNKGILDKVKQILRDATSKKLSLENKEIR